VTQDHGSWSVIVPGQPPSVNHGYRIVKQFRRNGVPYRTIALTPEAVAYKEYAYLITKTTRPSKWKPKGWIHLRYRFFLANRQDADNSLKFLNDAIASALGVDDDIFLPCVISKEIVPANEARVEITIE
jgi:Holliday junction resolvase RusA-like endonuclease